MENQQGKTEIDLAWLAGFIDGEGCIHLRKTAGARLRAMDLVYWRPSIRICNTHEPSLARVASILEANGLPFHVSHRDYPSTKHYKRAWDLEVTGIKRCHHWLTVILPYLFTKQAQAQHMLDFCESRLSKAPSAPYTDAENELVHVLRNNPQFPQRLHA